MIQPSRDAVRIHCCPVEHLRPDFRQQQAPPGRLAAACLLLAVLAWPAVAQETVVPKRNIRTGYAKVLSVEPVYQTLTATRMEQQCDGEAAEPEEERRGLGRLVDAVRDALGKGEEEGQAEAAPRPESGANCRMVRVEREFRRPIAYDVDYIYRGMKYRSRLPYDPGNRLRVQVSLTPYVPGDELPPDTSDDAGADAD